MIPTAFDYHAPANVDEAIQLLGQYGEEAKLLAGGHSLIPLMKLRLASPAHLIDLGKIGNLAYIREDGNAIAIGAMTPHATVAASDLVRRRVTVMAEAAASIGDVQVRNRGTLGGSLAHADPGADQPGVVLALEAELVARSANGQRTIPATEFFTGLFSTALEPGEVLTEIRVPALPPNSGSTYLKMANQASGYAIVGIAAVVTLDGETIRDARVGISGVAEMASRASAVEAALKGQRATPEAVKQAAQQASDGLEALGDIHASADYRLHLTRIYTERALNQALGRARGNR